MKQIAAKTHCQLRWPTGEESSCRLNKYEDLGSKSSSHDCACLCEKFCKKKKKKLERERKSWEMDSKEMRGEK